MGKRCLQVPPGSFLRVERKSKTTDYDKTTDDDQTTDADNECTMNKQDVCLDVQSLIGP